MRRGIIVLGLVCCAWSAQAGGLLERKDINEIAELMAEAHKSDKKNGMREAESECWKAMAKEARSVAHASMAYCGMAGMAGHLIAMSDAERTGKKILPYWTDDAVANRMVNFAVKMKIKESLVESTMDDEIGGNVENLAKALIRQGYLLD